MLRDSLPFLDLACVQIASLKRYHCPDHGRDREEERMEGKV